MNYNTTPLKVNALQSLNNLLSKITEIRGSSNKIYIWNGGITSFSLTTQIDYLQGRQYLSLEKFIEFNRDKPLFKQFFNENNIEELKKVVLPKKVDVSVKSSPPKSKIIDGASFIINTEKESNFRTS